MSEKISVSALEVLEAIQLTFDQRETEHQQLFSDHPEREIVTAQQLNYAETLRLIHFFETNEGWYDLSTEVRKSLLTLEGQIIPDEEKLVVVQGLQAWIADQAQ